VAEEDLAAEVFLVKMVLMDLEDLLEEQDLQDPLDLLDHEAIRVKWA
jgi:hypothetical protein